MATVLHSHDVASVSHAHVPVPVRRVGHLVAAALGIALLHVSRHLLAWGWPGFLTQDFDAVVGVVSASLVAGILCNLVLAVRDVGLPRVLAQLVTSGVAVVVGLRLLEVFPFDFSGYATDWSRLVRGGLMFVIAAAGLGLIGTIIRLAAVPDGPGDGIER